MIGILTKKHLERRAVCIGRRNVDLWRVCKPVAALVCSVALLSLACSSQSQQTQTVEPGAGEGTGIRAVMDAGPGEVGPGITEAEARELLDRLFREAGLRIVNDVPFTRPGIQLTLDGYDPERDIGYEYIATAEAGVEVDASERVALQEHSRIFLAGSASRDRLEEAAAAFLAALPGAASPDAAALPAP